MKGDTNTVDDGLAFVRVASLHEAEAGEIAGQPNAG